MSTKYSIEERSEACATVVMRITSGIFGVFGAVIKGVFKGLGFLPVVNGLRKAINNELASKGK